LWFEIVKQLANTGKRTSIVTSIVYAGYIKAQTLVRKYGAVITRMGRRREKNKVGASPNEG
jgi:hypothetical protein